MELNEVIESFLQNAKYQSAENVNLCKADTYPVVQPNSDTQSMGCKQLRTNRFSEMEKKSLTEDFKVLLNVLLASSNELQLILLHTASRRKPALVLFYSLHYH